MMTYKVDGQFIILTTSGKTTAAERREVYDAIQSDPKVPDGAFLIIDLRKYEVFLTPTDLENRVRDFLEAMSPKIGTSCAVVVGKTSERIGFDFNLIAAKSNFRVGIFLNEAAARAWLISGK